MDPFSVVPYNPLEISEIERMAQEVPTKQQPVRPIKRITFSSLLFSILLQLSLQFIIAYQQTNVETTLKNTHYNKDGIYDLVVKKNGRTMEVFYGPYYRQDGDFNGDGHKDVWVQSLANNKIIYGPLNK